MTNEKTNLKSFFESLAERMHNENDLSDMTYALCNANDEFRRCFLSFCFEEEVDSTELFREYQEGLSRPDFFLTDLKGQERLIEVKINDWNQHFEQYQKKFKNAKYAFIANYKYDEVVRWKIKTWEEFIKHIEKKQPKLIEDEIVKCYLDYLKSITNIRTFQTIDLSQCNSLTLFLNNIKKIFVQEYNFGIYCQQKKMYNDKWYGQYFVKGKLYFWIGLDFTTRTVCIAFVNHGAWTPKEILKKMKQIIKDKESFKYCDFIDMSGTSNDSVGNFWFNLKSEFFDALCDKTFKHQELILKEFIFEVFEKIGAKDDFLPKKEYLELKFQKTEESKTKNTSLICCMELPSYLDIIKNIMYDEYGWENNNYKKSFNGYYYGLFFKKRKYKTKFECWIGVHFWDNDFGVYIGMKEECIPKRLLPNTLGDDKSFDSEYFDFEIVSDGNYGDYWFALKEEKFNILCDETKSKEEQKEVLKNFIKEAFTAIGAEKYLK